MESLKKELSEKQKPVFELYQNLLSMKKKLEESGKPVTLENIKFIDCEGSSTCIKVARKSDFPAGELNIKCIKSMQDALKEIPNSLTEVCKNLLNKRGALLEVLEKITDPHTNREFFVNQLEIHKRESRILERSVHEVMQMQEKQVGDFVKTWQNVLQKGMPEALAENVELKKKLEEQGKMLREVTIDLQKAQNMMREDNSSNETLAEAHAQIENLQQKVKVSESVCALIFDLILALF